MQQIFMAGSVDVGETETLAAPRAESKEEFALAGARGVTSNDVTLGTPPLSPSSFFFPLYLYLYLSSGTSRKFRAKREA
jgi:hypothetical protein